jgi:ATP-dependent Clp protease ATP-binding subunit ClpC
VARDVERWLSPELRNRIDEIVVFRPLDDLEVRQIASRYIDELSNTLRLSGKSLVVESDALDRIVVEGFSPAYGVRHLKRVIDDCIKIPLSQQWSAVSEFRVSLRAGEVVVESSDRDFAAPAGADAVAV